EVHVRRRQRRQRRDRAVHPEEQPEGEGRRGRVGRRHAGRAGDQGRPPDVHDRPAGLPAGLRHDHAALPVQRLGRSDEADEHRHRSRHRRPVDGRAVSREEPVRGDCVEAQGPEAAGEDPVLVAARVQSSAPTPATAPAESPPGQRRAAWELGRRILRLFLYQRELTPIVITIGLFTYFTIKAGSTFTDSLSLSSAAGYAGPIGAIAVGEVLLLVLAEIDLSAGQVFLFAPWVEYWLHNLGVPLGLAILIALAVCCGVGAINGLITVRLNVPSFVTTLAMNFVLFGLVLIYSDQTQATPIPLSASTGSPGFSSQVMGSWLWTEILWVLE